MDDKVKTAAAGALTVAADVFIGVTGAGAIKSAYEVYALLTGRAADARLKAAVDGLLAEVANLKGYEGKEREHRFIELMARCKPEVEDLIWDMHRTVFFGRSREAWSYVLKLTADRVVNHQGVPDTFSRRAAWLLERCEAEDIAIFRQAVIATRKKLATEKPESFDAIRWCAHDTQVEHAQVAVYVERGRKNSITSHVHTDAADPRVVEAMILLGESRLGRTLGERQGVYLTVKDDRLARLLELFSR